MAIALASNPEKLKQIRKKLAANRLTTPLFNTDLFAIHIETAFLPPSDARAAFEKGAVDAWVIWDPFLAEAQKQSELNFSWKVYPEDLHGTVPLPTMRDGLVFLFKWYQFKHPHKYNNPKTSVKEIQALLDNQEQIYLFIQDNFTKILF